MKIFVVTWIDGECMNARLYTKRDDAEKLVGWCKNHDLNYLFAEETLDREILNVEMSKEHKEESREQI